jgi:CMP-N-acetylneuraminic acid synthetase
MNFINQISPLVTVYIPCHNYGRYLNKALDSLKKQLYKNWELFIIDDGSKDNSFSIANNFQQLNSDRVKVISNPSSLGLQKIANKVLSFANGKYIIRLDADDWFDESALLLMVAKLESNNKIGLVYGNYFYANEKGDVIGVENNLGPSNQDQSKIYPPHGACTMVRTRILKSMGGYSEEFNSQDGWELWYKILQSSKAAKLVAPLFYYRKHGKSLSRNSKRLLSSRKDIINKIRSNQQGSYIPSCLAVIPVRESFPGFEGVPYTEIKGKSMLQIAIESAQMAKNVTEIAVTSSTKVLEFSRGLISNSFVDKHLLIKRPDNLSDTNFNPREIMLHAGEFYYEKYKKYPDVMTFLNLHTPLRKPQHINNAIDTLIINQCDSVISVSELNEPTFMRGEDGLKILNPGIFININYEKEKIYQHKGDVIVVWWEVLKNHNMFGNNIGYVEILENENIKVLRKKDIDNLL